jgi:hypothetical protein|nr:MAG TPA: hypothetical protein [Caudoviricetes sp.]
MSKKTKAAWAIIQHSTGAALIEFPPTIGIETTKEVPLLANEITMCIRIAQIYTGEKYSKAKIISLLKEAGIAAGFAGGGAVIAAKVGKAAVKELINFAGPIGWGIKGLVGGSLTAGIGISFAKFCEVRFGEEHSLAY